ncbi:LysR family transcriptional regulator substrate-binding protein [Companilactobacillus metriopterae]|uniref:LysR family transcriptional regulator substrate-binding protein n=1 Tax=Companilactobacillus metriopterae TaxID=1909267 RepID=UPI001F513AB9|nr:LysR family transcriptional regulator substrate-binding protein [Companilactobacillus metriopterae]
MTEFDSVLMDEDDFVLVSPSSRDLNNQEEYIDISELANESFILRNEQTNLYKSVINLFEKSGITPDIFYKGNRFDLIAEMVAEGMGLSIVPRKIAESMTSNKIKIIDIIESPQSRLGFLKNKNFRQDNIDQFWNEIKKYELQ